jgi:hypothetical protein
MNFTIEGNGELLAVCENEIESVVRWREEELVLAGWRSGIARLIGERTDIDLHLACRRPSVQPSS